MKTLAHKARLASRLAFVSQTAEDHETAAEFHARCDALSASDYHMEMAAAHRRIAVRTRDTGERYDQRTETWVK